MRPGVINDAVGLLLVVALTAVSCVDGGEVAVLGAMATAWFYPWKIIL